MRHPKIKKVILYFLITVFGLIVLTVGLINTPLARRVITSNVNTILSNAGLPISVFSIEKITPRSVSVKGVLLAGTGGDTIIYAGQIKAIFSPRSLLHKKVYLHSASLSDSRISFLRKGGDSEINIAQAFSNLKTSKPKGDNSNMSPWEVSVSKVEINRLAFVMNDAVAGIYIDQSVDFIKVITDIMSITDRQILARNLEIRKASGVIKMAGSIDSGQKELGNPWTFGIANIELSDIEESYDNQVEELMLNISLKKGIVNTREADIKEKTINFQKALLSGLVAEIKQGKSSDTTTGEIHANASPFIWDIRGDVLELENNTISISDYHNQPIVPDTQSLIISNLNVHLADIVMTRDDQGVMVKDIKFDLDNGFMIKEMSGSFNSNDDATALKLIVETGNSYLDFDSKFGSGVMNLLTNPEEMQTARISIEKSTLSLKDLALFEDKVTSIPLVGTLAVEPFRLNGSFVLAESVLRIPDFSVSHASDFIFNIQGEVENGFSPEKATGNLQFELSDINTGWLAGILKEMGFEKEIGNFSRLSLNGSISDSLKSPQFKVNILSDLGDVSLDGSYNFATDSLNLNSDFSRILLGKLLNNPAFGVLYGSGEVAGKGFREKMIFGEAVVAVDSLFYKGYGYSKGVVDVHIEQEEVNFRLTIDDPALDVDLEVDMGLTDSIVKLHTSATFMAKLNDLNLYEDTLSVAANIDVSLMKGKSLFDADLNLSDIVLTTPGEVVKIDKTNGTFLSDSLRTKFSGRSDFFNFTILIEKPVTELVNILAEYGDYVKTFTDPQNNDPTIRTAHLPKIDSKISFSYHEALGLFLKQFHFSKIDISLINNPSDGKLDYSIAGDDLSYNQFAMKTLNTHITDSSGFLNVTVDAGQCSFFSYPVNKLLLSGRLGGWSGITSLSVLGVQNETLYAMSLNSRFDSTMVYLSVPSKQLIMNGVEWALKSEEFLSFNFNDKTISPALEMSANDSYFHFTSELGTDKMTMRCDLNNVNSTSFLPENIFNGSPRGIISGSAQYEIYDKKGQRLIADLNFKDTRWSDMKFSNIELSGKFDADTLNNYTIEMVTLLDSSQASVKAIKVSGENRTLNAEVKDFPLKLAEPFVKEILSDLKGSISGNLDISSQNGNEDIEGEILIRDGHMRIVPLNSAYTMPDERINITGKRVLFDKFTILDSLNKKLLVDGSLDMANREAISVDLLVTSTNLQVMNIEHDENVAFSGKIFIDSRLSVKGLLSNPSIKGNIRLTNATEVFYSRKEDLSLSESEQIITFVSSDTSANPQAINPLAPAINRGLSIETVVDIDPATKINFSIAQKLYAIELMIMGGGSLNYNMLENSQMNLSGKYEIREGMAEVKMIGWPNKTFRITPGGFIRWVGNVEDPDLQFEAVNRVRTSYTNPVDGKMRDVDFNVVLKLSARISELDLVFTINTPDQYLMSIINTLSPEEQMRQAITVLLFEKIDLPGISTSTDYVTQQVNQMLASQLNALTKTSVKGIDISFGLDTYTAASQSGGEETKTSLSYDVRKSLLNNRAQIEVSGRFNDSSSPQGSSSMSLNNFSFEYRLDSAATKFLKIYNEHTYEDVFEGEVIKTGIGFVYRKSYRSLGEMWKRKEKKKKMEEPAK